MLRVARFAARFGFAVAPETLAADARAGRVRRACRRWRRSASGRSSRAGSCEAASVAAARRVARNAARCARCCPRSTRCMRAQPRDSADNAGALRRASRSRSSTRRSAAFALPVRYAVLTQRAGRSPTRATRGRVRVLATRSATCAAPSHVRAPQGAASIAATPRASPRAGIARCRAREALAPAAVLDLISPPTRCAGRSGSTRCCRRASATHAAAAGAAGEFAPRRCLRAALDVVKRVDAGAIARDGRAREQDGMPRRRRDVAMRIGGAFARRGSRRCARWRRR